MCTSNYVLAFLMTVERVNYGKLNGTAVSFKVFSINLPNKIVERGRNFDKL